MERGKISPAISYLLWVSCAILCTSPGLGSPGWLAGHHWLSMGTSTTSLLQLSCQENHLKFQRCDHEEGRGNETGQGSPHPIPPGMQEPQGPGWGGWQVSSYCSLMPYNLIKFGHFSSWVAARPRAAWNQADKSQSKGHRDFGSLSFCRQLCQSRADTTVESESEKENKRRG